MLSNNLTKDIPADRNILCLVNCRNGVVNSATGDIIRSYPLLKEPLFGSNLGEIKSNLASMFNLSLEYVTEWEAVGDNANFASSICIELRGILYDKKYVDVLFFFDVYTTVNTLNLL
jgi:hypothetical protein